MTFYFWQNILSPHQMPYIRELAELGHSVCVISERDISPEREKLGWTSPETGKCKVTLDPDSSQIEKIITDSPSASIHLLAGAQGKSLGKQATRLLIQRNHRMGIISEAPDLRGPARNLRLLKYTKERLGAGRHFDFVLAMGEIGTRWFRACGYPDSKIFEFGYVVESLPVDPVPPYPPQILSKVEVGPVSPFSTPRILYAGQLIQRKGLDIFLIALAQVDSPFICDMIGSGPLESDLKELTHRLNLSDKINWLGKRSAEEVRVHMQNADLFVLPSYHDGWGAVVNEALMAGTPVIASRECGSSCLLKNHLLGEHYSAQDTQTLAYILQQRVKAGPIRKEDRQYIRGWSNRIEAMSSAHYVEACMKHIYESQNQPVPPWQN